MTEYGGVHIGSVETEIVITEGVGSLGPEELQRIVRLVLEHLQHREQSMQQRQNDVTLHDRVFRSEGL